jgi:hypothetical protein
VEVLVELLELDLAVQLCIVAFIEGVAPAPNISTTCQDAKVTLGGGE